MDRIAVLRYVAVGLAVLCLLTLTGASGRPAEGDQTAGNPSLILWAWERPESLLFAGSDHVGVAFLAESIYLNHEPRLRPRMQPLRVGKSTPLIAVVRLEVTGDTPSKFEASYVDKVTLWIADMATLPQVRTVQIDFDATQSQRPFYRALLSQLRPLLPAGTSVSITALGSWCLGDDWLGGLPIDEAVPMLFRMGVDRENIVRAGRRR